MLPLHASQALGLRSYEPHHRPPPPGRTRHVLLEQLLPAGHLHWAGHCRLSPAAHSGRPLGCVAGSGQTREHMSNEVGNVEGHVYVGSVQAV